MKGQHHFNMHSKDFKLRALFERVTCSYVQLPCLQKALIASSTHFFFIHLSLLHIALDMWCLLNVKIKVCLCE